MSSAIDEMPPGDDHLVAAAEKALAICSFSSWDSRLRAALIQAGRFQPLLHDLQDVAATRFRGQIVALVGGDSVGNPVAKVFPPIVQGHDLE